MYKLISKLIVYRNIGPDSILFRLGGICRELGMQNAGSFHSADHSGSTAGNKDELAGRTLDLIHELLDLATTYGFDGNLWQNYLAFLLAMTECPFTLVSEKNGKSEGSVNSFVMNDYSIFMELFNYDFTSLEQELELNCFSIIGNYHSVEKNEQFYNVNVSRLVRALSDTLAACADVQTFYDTMLDFYKKYGVGMFGMNKAFRIQPGSDGRIVPITATSPVVLSDLIGYEDQKEQLMRNTEAFLAGLPANNVLLYGDAGTGKSTSIKALLNMYYEQGLRMIEVYKHDFQHLPQIISTIKARNYKFIIYMDDLSFEGCETEYKYLKAVIEGDLEVKPANVLIYATSNRRHLIRETFDERKEMEDNDVHRLDTMAEKLSLADRFGISIGYFKPQVQAFYDMVIALARREPSITLSDEELRACANRWALSHGERSGRVAQQLIWSLSTFRS